MDNDGGVDKESSVLSGTMVYAVVESGVGSGTVVHAVVESLRHLDGSHLTVSVVGGGVDKGSGVVSGTVSGGDLSQTLGVVGLMDRGMTPQSHLTISLKGKKDFRIIYL